MIEAIPDGRGVHMIDGKMQDDATWKQCKVMVELAEMLAREGPGARRGLRALSGADGEPFRHRLRVRYNECDPQGVVFNANYLAYFDIAITELWRELRRLRGRWSTTASTWSSPRPASATWRRSRFDDEVDLVVRGVRLGNTSMTTELAIERAGEPIAEGELRHVFVEHARGRDGADPRRGPSRARALRA